MQKISLQSLGPHAGCPVSFENDGANINQSQECREALGQPRPIESNLSVVYSKSPNCSSRSPPEDSDRSELDNSPGLLPTNKVGSVLGMASSFDDRSLGLAQLLSPNFCINASNPSAATFLKIDRNLIQSSPSVGLLIVNQADANKLVQQTHSLSLTSKLTPANATSYSCPNGSNGFHSSLSCGGQRLSGCSISSRANSAIDGPSLGNQLFAVSHHFRLATAGSLAEQAGGGHPNCPPNSQTNQNASQLSNENNRAVCQSVSQVNSIQLNAENDGKSMNFLEHCPSGGPFSIQPVKCY